MINLNNFISKFDENYNNYSSYDYYYIQKQMESAQPITFGSPINVLILTDRLFPCAVGLNEYLVINGSDISVELMYNDFDGTIKYIQSKPIDLLIIAGMLSDKTLYGAAQLFRFLNKYSCDMLYIIPDESSILERIDFGISNFYDRRKPVEEFILFMRKRYDEETMRMHKTVSPEVSREQLWKESSKKLEQAGAIDEIIKVTRLLLPNNLVMNAYHEDALKINKLKEQEKKEKERNKQEYLQKLDGRISNGGISSLFWMAVKYIYLMDTV